MRSNQDEDPYSYRQYTNPSGGQPPGQGRGQGQGQGQGQPPGQGQGQGQPPGQSGQPQQQPGQGFPPSQGQPPSQSGQPPFGQGPQSSQPPQSQPPQGQSPQQFPGQPTQQWHQPPSAPGAGQSGMSMGQPSQMGSGQMGPPGATQQKRPQLRTARIEEIIETDVVTAERNTPVATIVAAMAQNDVGSVVIVEDDKPVGIITDRTIALSLQTAPNVSDRTADDLLSESVVTGTVDMNVFDVLQRLSDQQIRRLPIVDEDGTLQGIVTLDDLLVLLGTELGNATEIIEAQSSRL